MSRSQPFLMLCGQDSRVSMVAASRLAPARRRARLAKTTLIAGGAAGFGLAMILARSHVAGHHRQSARPLAAPPGFVRIVRQNLLEAGIVAPAQAPSVAETATS
jgi:hypothetical protein